MSATCDVKRVVVIVSGGVAEVTECPDSVDVEIRDVDSLNVGEETPRTTPLFWDCECKKDYIHPKDESSCDECGTDREDQPDAHLEEVLRLPLTDAMRERICAERAIPRYTKEVHPGWMVPPPKDRVGFAFVEMGDSVGDHYALDGQADVFLDEEGRIWLRTPWDATRLPRCS